MEQRGYGAHERASVTVHTSITVYICRLRNPHLAFGEQPTRRTRLVDLAPLLFQQRTDATLLVGDGFEFTQLASGTEHSV